MMRRRNAAIVAVALTAGLAFADVGTVTYLQGDVTVVRDGRRIWEEIDFGFPVESFDMVETGQDGLAELLLDRAGGLEARVTVQPETSFYLDVDTRRTDAPGALELLGGSIGLAIGRPGAGFQVRTEAATMGVRGTVFSVATSVQGDILVTCTEGSVACSTDGGPMLLATPERAVEARVGETLRNLTVGGVNDEAFRRDWMLDRLAAFRSQPLPLLDYYAGRYLQLRDRFRDAYRTLMDRRDILDKWMAEDERGVAGSMMERMRERRAILPGLLRMRRVLFFLERVYFRLDTLIGAMDDRIGDARLSTGATVREFAALFRNDAGLLSSRMHEVRYVFKLFADRNDGRLPFDDIGSEMEPMSDPMAEPNPFPLRNQDPSGM